MPHKPTSDAMPVTLLRLPPGVAVALGGGLGATTRFLVAGWVATWSQAGFPWGTFAVNVFGSFVLGLVYRALPPPAASFQSRAFLMIGFCGGFTTFSTFDYETLSLLRQARYSAAGLYSLGSVLTCVIGVYAGFRMAGMLRMRHHAEA
jgi:fluoride exporter